MNLKKILIFIMIFSVVIVSILICSLIWIVPKSTAKKVQLEENQIKVGSTDKNEMIIRLSDNKEVEEIEFRDNTEDNITEENIKEDNIEDIKEKMEEKVIERVVQKKDEEKGNVKPVEQPIKQQENKEQPVNKEQTIKQPTTNENTKPVNQVTFVDVKDTVYATNNINVRTEANSTSSSVGILKKGSEIARTGIGSNGWDRIIYNNKVGYVNHLYISKEKIVVPNEETKPVVTKYITASLSAANQYPSGWLQNYNTKIIALQNEFVSGTYWNHMGTTATGNKTTQIPCNHSSNGNSYCNEYLGSTALVSGVKNVTRSAGFASMLSDRIFGTEAKATIFYNYDAIKVGDQARINFNSHTVFIIDKTDDYVIVAECNADGRSCRIEWGRKILRSQLSGYYITRR